jgi:hypothetical protein
MQPTSGSTPWAHVGAVILGLTALLTLILTAFAWPASNTEPRDLPIGIAAPAAASAQVEQGLVEAAGPDAFDISHLDGEAAAVEAIDDRDIYGAILVDARGSEVLTASAASPTVAQLLGQIAANLPTADGSRVPVTDVVPLPADDPRGAGLAAGALPWYSAASRPRRC